MPMSHSEHHPKSCIINEGDMQPGCGNLSMYFEILPPTAPIGRCVFLNSGVGTRAGLLLRVGSWLCDTPEVHDVIISVLYLHI